MSAQYGRLQSTNGWDRFVSFGTPANFNRFGVLASLYTDVAQERSTKLYMMFGRLLRWYTIYISGAHAPTLTEFWQVQNSLCVQILCSPIYIGSVTARHSSSGRQQNFAAFSRGCHLYSTGRPSRWASAHILVWLYFCYFYYSKLYMIHVR